MKCHGSEALAAQFGFSPHVPSEFEESMHYRKVTIGEKKAPLCFDCHGAHNVQSMQAPNSLKNSPAERAKVCSKCHRGSNETFAMTFDHRPTTWEEKPLQYAVIAMFKTLTLGTFVGLGLFMLLDISSLIRCVVFRKKMGLHAHHKPKKVEYVERLTASQRWQHFFMLSSVLTLVVTGWPLFSPESETSIAVMNLLGGAGTVAIIHRTAGLVMIADFLYHLYYLFTLFRKGGKILAFPMLPTPKDVIDAWGLILFFFGLRKDKPAFKQFAFFEKFDYLKMNDIIKYIVAIIFPLVVLIMQPDYGSFLICLVVIIFACFMSSFKRKIFYSILGSGIFLILITIFTQPYRVKRILAFMDPWKNARTSGFQIIQSYLAFANGAFWGQGLGNSNEKLFYLPEAHNDFIFSVLAEELGFIGVLITVILFLLLIYWGFNLVISLPQKTFQILVSSVVFLIGFQALINMGVVLGMLPTKGLNLPFISYGGSSIVANFFGLGLMIAVANYSKKLHQQ